MRLPCPDPSYAAYLCAKMVKWMWPQRATVVMCAMHPQIISDEPDKCPICGMTLVKKGGGE